MIFSDDYKVNIGYKTELEEPVQDFSRVSSSLIQSDDNENSESDRASEFEPMKIEYIIGSLLPRAETTRAPSKNAAVILEWKMNPKDPLIVSFDCYEGSLSRYYLTFTLCKKQVSDLFPAVEIGHGSLTLSDGRLNVLFEAKTIMYFTKFDHTDLSVLNYIYFLIIYIYIV